MILTNNLKAFTARMFDVNSIRRSLIGAQPREVEEKVRKIVVPEKIETTLTPSYWPLYPLASKRITVEVTYTSAK